MTCDVLKKLLMCAQGSILLPVCPSQPMNFLEDQQAFVMRGFGGPVEFWDILGSRIETPVDFKPKLSPTCSNILPQSFYGPYDAHYWAVYLFPLLRNETLWRL